MGNKMLIDATHPEETRVVVVRGNRVEEFDFESAAKKQLRGNIYLAKVTRVEPSLQAAFVNYGGNRHGFLAFNEIHPDYYHLPLAERQALKQEEQRASRAAQTRNRREQSGRSKGEAGAGGHAAETGYGEAGEADNLAGPGESPGSFIENAAPAGIEAESADNTGIVEIEAGAEDGDAKDTTIALEAALPATKYSGDLYASADSGEEDTRPSRLSETENELDEPSEHESEAAFEPESEPDMAADDDEEDEEDGIEVINDDGEGAPVHARRGKHADESAEAGTVESVGSEDALEELPERVRRRRRVYKIQEVIKRGQIILVQVVKEERGNKGAALTTYLSLAGRYTVLMPNTGSGGGISRKISSPADRKRLREIAGELDVPDGMGLIIRTAGAARTKTEVKRDYEYLLRLWENVRELTLRSSAPCLVYEEGDLIKRSIRDLYNREIDEVLVAGDDAYKDAKDFMRMLMPSHAKNVQYYKDPEPVFIRYEVERQLNAMFSPQVTLPSGGYIVLNQTEALVAIDVNSGKSTREFSIEETALKTNLEASEEIARQLRLRDLAGLIVVDFIDMEEKRNNRAVERKLKECLRNDRARIQVGRISHFGLLEMSRQRLRTGMIEGSTCQCPTCQGTGVVRSTESVALSVLRGLEDWLRTNPLANLNAVTSTEVALYILNHKRGYLRDIEQRYGVALSIIANERIQGGNFHLEKLSSALPAPTNAPSAVRQTAWADEPAEDEETERAEVGEDAAAPKARRRRRRRGGRAEANGDGEHAADTNGSGAWDANGEGSALDEEVAAAEPGEIPQVRRALEGGEDENGGRRRSRRRGRRGGRQRLRHNREDGAAGTEESAALDADRPGEAVFDEPGLASSDDAPHERRDELPLKNGGEAHQLSEPHQAEPSPSAQAFPEAAHVSLRELHEPPTPSRLNGHGAPHAGNAADGPSAEPASEAAEAGPVLAEEPATPPPPKPRGTKRGWWQRREDG